MLRSCEVYAMHRMHSTWKLASFFVGACVCKSGCDWWFFLRGPPGAGVQDPMYTCVTYAVVQRTSPKSSGWWCSAEAFSVEAAGTAV